MASADNVLSLPVDLRLYGEDALHETVYRFAANGALISSVDWPNQTAHVHFSKVADSATASLEEAFYQGLTDQVLRIKIRAETEAVRNLILANAFSDSALSQD